MLSAIKMSIKERMSKLRHISAMETAIQNQIFKDHLVTWKNVYNITFSGV